jgi:transglutaminase-like putative cysteine protease
MIPRRAWLDLALAVLALACAQSAAAANSPPYTIAPPDAWVLPLEPKLDAPSPQDKISDGEYFLLFDRQVRFTNDAEYLYLHAAVRVINESGVDGNSQLNLNVDPTFEQLVIHDVTIRRGAHSERQLVPDQIRVLADETELERQLYNGRLSVNLLMHDLKPGDVIEYSYTTRLANPLFDGKFYESLITRWSAPVLMQRLRVLRPENRALPRRAYGEQPEPTVRRLGNEKEETWIWHSPEALQFEGDRPRWHHETPYLEFSEWSSWQDVANWATRLYAPRSTAGPLTRKKAAEIAARYSSPARRVRAALDFVQNDIRYTGIEIGRGSHEPTLPDTVIARSFGDCKDKSLLMVTLLRELGIEAAPALVNSDIKERIDADLPSPFAFDHAIVWTQVGGKDYWLDATDTMQGGTLENLEQAHFGAALLIRPQSTELKKMPAPSTEEPTREAFEHFDLTGGTDAQARLTVRTVYRRRSADAMRAYIARTSLDERATPTLNYYARYYPKIKRAAPPAVSDDREANVLEVAESYTIEESFRPYGKASRFKVHADELERFTDEPDTRLRSMPLAVRFPVHVREHIDVDFSRTWEVREDTVVVDDPAFTYRSAIVYHDRHFAIDYDFRTLADHVMPERVAEYLGHLKTVENDLAYHFTTNPKTDAAAAQSKSKELAYPLAVLATLMIAAIFTIALLRFVRWWDPEPRKVDDGAPREIGGWLIFPAITIALQPFYAANDFWGALSHAELSQWHRLANLKGVLGAVAEPLLLIDIAVGFMLIPYAIGCAALFFHKRSSAPLHFCINRWAGVIYACATTYLVHLTSGGASVPVADMIAAAIVAGLFTLYMLASRRVRATFTVRPGAASGTRPSPRVADAHVPASSEHALLP